MSLKSAILADIRVFLNSFGSQRPTQYINDGARSINFCTTGQELRLEIIHAFDVGDNSFTSTGVIFNASIKSTCQPQDLIKSVDDEGSFFVSKTIKV
jgi:hypothetical protein